MPGGMFDDTGEKQNSNGPKSISAPGSPSLKITTTKPVMTPLLISGGWNVKVLPREFLNNSILPGTAYKQIQTVIHGKLSTVTVEKHLVLHAVKNMGNYSR